MAQLSEHAKAPGLVVDGQAKYGAKEFELKIHLKLHRFAVGFQEIEKDS